MPPFCLCLVVGIVLAFILPKTYEARTLILVEAQRVPSDFVQSIVSIDFDTRINTISQQILSRTNLEKIIQELGLFTDEKSKNMFMEEKLETLRKNLLIDVTHSGGRRSTDSFSISYQGEDPEKIVKVVNTLASYFIDENLRVRESQATGTSEFLEGELASMRQKLESVEEKMKEYRRMYMGELPEQLESNLRILDRVEEQILETTQRLSEARNRLVALQNQPTALAGGQAAAGGVQPVPAATDLEQLKEQLAQLRTKYTSQHPDIIRLEKTIADLEKEAEAEMSVANLEPASRPASRVSPAQLRQINETQRELKSIEAELGELRAQRDMYKARVENTPKREQELMSLRRDYQNIQESYSSLLNRKLEAEIAVNLEKKQKGERFRIIDPAKIPEKPVKPNMKKLFVVVVGLGLGIGCGITFLLEYLDSSFKRTEDVEEFLKIPVIAAVPVIAHPKEIMLRKVNTICSILFAGVSLVFFAVFVLVVVIGPDKIVLLKDSMNL